MLSTAVGETKQTISAAESQTKPLSPLFELIRKHDLTGIKALASKEDPKKFWNQLDETRGITPLKQKPTIHSENLSALAYAARLGFLDIVKYFCYLDRWFSHIDESSSFNQELLGAAFEEALIFGYLEVVNYLISFRRASTITSQSWAPTTLLEHVISPQHKTLATVENIPKLTEDCNIKYLTQNELNRALLMVVDDKLWLNWIRAQENQVMAKEKTNKVRIALTKILLDAKADPNCKNSYEISVLTLATKSGIVEMREDLLKKGAKSEPFEDFLLSAGIDGLNPLTIKFLIRRGFFDRAHAISAARRQAALSASQQMPVERKEEKSLQERSAAVPASVSGSGRTEALPSASSVSGSTEIELQDLSTLYVRPRGF